MYIIVSYDVNACRCNKVNKILKNIYLTFTILFLKGINQQTIFKPKNELYKTIHFDEIELYFI